MIISTVSAVRRADQVYFEQISTHEALTGGVAFYAPEYPFASGDNSFREVLIESADLMEKIWTQVETFYQQHDLRCLSWAPSAEQSIEVIEPFLSSKHLVKRTFAAMTLLNWPELAINKQVRVLPARAMRRAFRELHQDATFADLSEQRMDYPQFDVFVAILEGQPVGRCGMLQVGEIAGIYDLFVAEALRGKKVGSTLLAHVLDMAKRLMMKHICMKIDAEEQSAGEYLTRFGFVEDGELIEFHRL